MRIRPGASSALEAVEDLEGELEAAERGHQVGALDAVAHGEEHLAGDLHTFLARLGAAGVADDFLDICRGAAVA